ncbi:hypothetical protein PC129_g21982 [Phytophthora cactorum]|nr:hypothetical protein C6341_g5444 [Phytophthora cactorum]KAG3205699.1 hypothetical protein PC129_g21982 [Phytophthora cactorum]
MPSLYHRLLETWESTQVELNGSYSSERVSDLAQYTRKTSWLHVMVVILLSPLPCLLVTVIIDALPLADPSEGLQGSNSFWIREYYSFLVITFLATEQFRYSVPVLPYPLKRAFVHAAIVSAFVVGIMYGLALLIGFPLPFSILVVTPPWLSFVAFFLTLEWRNKIRETPGSGTMLTNVIKLWMCQVLMVVIYPPYYFIFTTLSPNGQTAFSLLLPVIKLAMRNIFGRTVVHLSDEVPEVITFNIEIYNALFISYCMQNSPSFGTTLIVTAALLVQLALSLRDVYEATHRIERAERQLGEEHQYGDPRYLIIKSSVGSLKMSALHQADTLLLSNAGNKVNQRNGTISIRVRSAGNLKNSSLQDDDVLAESNDPIDNFVVGGHNLRFESRGILQVQGLAGVCVQPVPEHVMPAPKCASQQLSATSLQYVLEVRKLMYLTEFLVLINYVGVFIPLIFSIYMVVMYNLPNRMYYAQLAPLTKDELYDALKNVMFNCSLKLVGLILLCFVLQYKLRLSAIHQLAFVLEKQWFSVQTKAVFWVYYNVQCSLQHQGYDYSFEFSWLRESNFDSMNSSMPQTP